MKLFLLACKVLYREICYCVSQSPNEVDVHFMPQGLHNYGKKGMQEGLGKVLAEVDEDKYDAILLGYGLCNNGVTDLSTRKIPLVITRAHDCLTLLMGSKEKYQKYFMTHPGTYYLSSGWIERTDDQQEVKQLGLQTKDPMGGGLEELIEKYGEEKANYIYEKMYSNMHYRRITLIEMGIEPKDQFEKIAREEADKKKWEYEKMTGDLRLIRKLIDGQWDEADFLVVPPGKKIKPAIASDEIIRAED